MRLLLFNGLRYPFFYVLTSEVNQPALEIIILTYNSASTLKATLDSIYRSYYPKLKLVLSDNASTDDTLKVAESYSQKGLQIRARAKTIPMAAHWNLCIKECEADFLVLAHSDDLYSPAQFTSQIDFLLNEPKCDIVFTGGTYIDKNAKRIFDLSIPQEFSNRVLSPLKTIEKIMSVGNSFLLCPSAMYRTKLFKEIGVFREDIPIACDLEYWLRTLKSNFGLAVLSEKHLQYRLSQNQTSAPLQVKSNAGNDFFSVLDEYIKHWPVSATALENYERLRWLHAFNQELVLFSVSPTSTTQHIERLIREGSSKSFFKHIGGIDKIRIHTTRALLPFFKTNLARHFTKVLISQTDPRSGKVLASAIRLVRFFKN